ncbi:DUF7344 domain-containing protein [Halocatena halophila]|uniref:DUF7344 domain-containing protein n=1 Tax=Halocatena halophila TaxID=2814576 RepID=UPI002ECFF173
MSQNETTGSSESLSQDTVFDLLSSPRRRYVLHYLRSESSGIELTNLADHVAAWEYDTTVDSLSEQQRKRAYVSLYQTHVPKLEEAGIVTYDSDSGRVELTSSSKTIEKYLPAEDGPEIPWELVYPSMTVVCVLLFAVGTIETGPFSLVPVTAVGVLILLVFAVTSLVHLYTKRQQRRALPITPPDDE